MSKALDRLELDVLRSLAREAARALAETRSTISMSIDLDRVQFVNAIYVRIFGRLERHLNAWKVIESKREAEPIESDRTHLGEGI